MADTTTTKQQLNVRIPTRRAEQLAIIAALEQVTQAELVDEALATLIERRRRSKTLRARLEERMESYRELLE